MNLVMAFEKEFKIKFTDEEINEMLNYELIEEIITNKNEEYQILLFKKRTSFQYLNGEIVILLIDLLKKINLNEHNHWFLES